MTLRDILILRKQEEAGRKTAKEERRKIEIMERYSRLTGERK